MADRPPTRRGGSRSSEALPPAELAAPLEASPEHPSYQKTGEQDGDDVLLRLPWANIDAPALGDMHTRKLSIIAMRETYLPKSILLTTSDYRFLLSSFKAPLRPRAELMVQMLVSALCRPATKKATGDDSELFAASLRFQKSEEAFDEMANEFEHYISCLDMRPTFNLFFAAYGAIKNVNDVIPGVAVPLISLHKHQLAVCLAKMDLTLGNETKLKREEEQQIADQQKSQSRWAALATLLAPDDNEEQDSAVAGKVRSVVSGRPMSEHPMSQFAKVAKFLVIKEKAEQKRLKEEAAAALKVGHGEDGGDADSDEVADTITPLQDVNPAEKKKIQIKSLIRRSSRDKRISAAVSLMDKDARSKFHVNDEDTLMTQVAKLTVLEEEFMTMTASAQELQRLWNDADSNGNGDMSLTEWQGYASLKFNALASNRANKKAFNEAATSGHEKDADDTPGGSSMPVLNRSNFRLFLNRAFDYNKCHYAFNWMDSSGDDRISWEEYKKRRKVVLKILELDPEMHLSGLTAREEFDEISVEIVGVRGLHDKRGTTKLGKKHVMQAFDTQKVTRVVTYQSLTRWYRKVLDRPSNGLSDINAGLKDGSGLMVDIDEFCNLLLECHYKTRTTTPAERPANKKGKRRASASSSAPATNATTPAVAPAAAPAVKMIPKRLTESSRDLGRNEAA
eukprot:gene1810-8143_t